MWCARAVICSLLLPPSGALNQLAEHKVLPLFLFCGNYLHRVTIRFKETAIPPLCFWFKLVLSLSMPKRNVMYSLCVCEVNGVCGVMLLLFGLLMGLLKKGLGCCELRSRESGCGRFKNELVEVLRGVVMS